MGPVGRYEPHVSVPLARSIDTLGLGDAVHTSLLSKLEACTELREARAEEVKGLHARSWQGLGGWCRLGGGLGLRLQPAGQGMEIPA